jgi:DNA-binding CsgD family transcriptional regulator
MLPRIMFGFELLTLIASASAGGLLYALWRRTADRRALDAFRFYVGFLAILAGDFSKTWLAYFIVGVPIGGTFTFAAYPESFAWFFPVVLLVSPLTPALIPLGILPLLESVIARPIAVRPALFIRVFCVAVSLANIVFTGLFCVADQRGVNYPTALSALGAVLSLAVFALIAALSVYAWAVRRAIADPRAAAGFSVFVAVLAAFLPLLVMEYAFNYFRGSSPLARAYFDLLPGGLKFEWALFLAVAMICQSKVAAVLFGPGLAAPVAAASDGATADAVVEAAVEAGALLARFKERGLSGRECEIAGMAIRGVPNKEIAVRLGISHATVKNHLTNAYRKLGVSSRWDLLAIGR